MSLAKVSIITVNFNQAQLTQEMLQSVFALSYPNLEVIVVDNGSKENAIPQLQRLFPEIIAIRSDKNLGFSGGNNLGIAKATGEYLFFVNNDTLLADGLVEKLLECFDTIPKLGAVSPLIMYFPSAETQYKRIIQYAGTTLVNGITARNKTLHAGEENLGQFAHVSPQPTAYVHGAAMMMPRSVIQQVGKMPESFFLYYEELDWSEQIRRAGYKIYVQTQAEIIHKESAAVGALSPLKTYYLNRNRIFFMRRNRSTLQYAAFLLFLVFFTIPKNTISFLIKGQWTHLKAFYRAIYWNVAQKDKTLPSENKAVNTFLVS